ncbi:hypothetical protein GCM10010246_33540 [Streptomyces cuspidosporus]|uniref:Uncharacterized protein n=1 Tax=Streptomyces cuspidosporus TaxID=66882 RepID=A0ABN3G624_9ACTN
MVCVAGQCDHAQRVIARHRGLVTSYETTSTMFSVSGPALVTVDLSVEEFMWSAPARRVAGLQEENA